MDSAEDFSIEEIEYLERFTGATFEDLVDSNYKALSKASVMGIGNDVLVQKGLLLDDSTMRDWRGIIETHPGIIPDYILRRAESQASILGAAVNLRRSQCREYAKISDDDTKPGFHIKTRDKDYKPSKEDIKTMRGLEEWFLFGGRMDHPAALERDDNLLSAMKFASAEYMIIDKSATEIRHDSRGKLFDYIPLDAATIKKVVPEGFQGGKQDFRFAPFISHTTLSDKMATQREKQFPPIQDIRYVQEIDGFLTAAFTKKDLIYSIRQERIDVRYRGQGYSPIQQAMEAVTAFINSMSWNAENFNGSAIPKIALVNEKGQFNKPDLRAFQREWQANYTGRGQFKIPLLQGPWQVLDLLKNNREMEYDKYIKFVSALVFAVLGIDATELGLRLDDSQPILSENAEGRQQYSKSRGLHDYLGAMADVWNTILRRNGYLKFEFEYTGIVTTDKEAEQNLISSQIKTYKTVNEVRTAKDMKPLPPEVGDIILDPTWMQAKQAAAQAAAAAGPQQDDMSQFGDFGDIINEAADEAMDEKTLAKAELLPRTLLV